MTDEVNYLAREILDLLENEGMQTIPQLNARYKYKWSLRTLRYAIKQLKDEDLVERIPNLMDMRSGAYRLKKARVNDTESVAIEVE